MPPNPARPTESAPLLECRNLSVSIGEVDVVDDLDLCLDPGRSIGILGPNGVGKTTLLMTLAGIRSPESGQVLLNARPMQRMRRSAIARALGMLTQNTRFAFDASALEVVLSGRHPHLGPLGRESADDFERARRAMAEVGLDGLSQRSCRELSGGEQRRLALAVVLAQDPEVMLLDEPTNHLDPAHQVDVLDRLWRRIHGPSRSQIMALHDINLATCYCTDVLMLFGNGQWKLGPAPEMLSEHQLSRLYRCPIRAVSDGAQTVFAVASRDA